MLALAQSSRSREIHIPLSCLVSRPAELVQLLSKSLRPGGHRQALRQSIVVRWEYPEEPAFELDFDRCSEVAMIILELDEGLHVGYLSYDIN